MDSNNTTEDIANRPVYPALQIWKDGDDCCITTVCNPHNRIGDKYDCCRIFCTYTDLHLFAAEHPDAQVPDKSYILNRIENIRLIRDIVSKYKEIYTYQYRIIRERRFVWSRKYTQKNLDHMVEDFINDYHDLKSWCASTVIPKETDPDGFIVCEPKFLHSQMTCDRAASHPPFGVPTSADATDFYKYKMAVVENSTTKKTDLHHEKEE